jgi:hypothetical protein
MVDEDALSDADTVVGEDRWDEEWDEGWDEDTITRYHLAWHERMDALFEQWEAREEQMGAYRDPWTAAWMPAVH